MKGFPNQVADLRKLATAMSAIVAIDARGDDLLDDGVLGQALVRTGVAGTGHTPKPIDDYIREQLLKPKSGQSFRTTARGLRELFRLLGFITGTGQVTLTGHRAASFARSPLDAEQTAFWRRQILNMTHADEGGNVSHPYQVLLRLVAKKPGITRARCALALEARTDSPEELERIATLADSDEDSIRIQIGETQTNWDNAKKILPSFAEQLRDVLRDPSDGFHIADAPGQAGSQAGSAAMERASRYGSPAPRVPRTSRSVTPDTIGRSGTGDNSNKLPPPPFEPDPAAAARTAQLRADRLRRHNLLVQRLATRLHAAGATLFEGAFDILALSTGIGVLVEVKTLDGTMPDEIEQVRAALAQLLYYEAFVTEPVAGDAGIRRVACFEHRISPEHIAFLNQNEIAVIWLHGNIFVGDDTLSANYLGRFLDELR